MWAQLITTRVKAGREEKRRAREEDPRRKEGLQAAQKLMAEIFDGPPEFVDLTIVNEFTP
jgi:hypothetical protein